MGCHRSDQLEEFGRASRVYLYMYIYIYFHKFIYIPATSLFLLYALFIVGDEMGRHGGDQLEEFGRAGPAAHRGPYGVRSRLFLRLHRKCQCVEYTYIFMCVCISREGESSALTTTSTAPETFRYRYRYNRCKDI